MKSKTQVIKVDSADLAAIKDDAKRYYIDSSFSNHIDPDMKVAASYIQSISGFLARKGVEQTIELTVGSKYDGPADEL